jgi:hypothetical protein
VPHDRTNRELRPPAETVGNDAPLGVQITVSPMRVQNTETPQRMAQQTTSSLLTPNSHRRPHTPHRRAVTPPTPHVMVRRSASHKYIFSQDMIADTSNQANHCFYFPTRPSTKTEKKVIDNEQIIIMPEMANAVICPETSKSLKHQELITKLRIKWMRSTAN